MTISVRWTDVNDLDAITPLFDAYRQFYTKPSDLALSREFIAQRYARDDSKIAIAENAQGQAVGFAQLYPLLSSLTDDLAHSRVWLLNDLFVSPTARRMKVGEALLAYVQDFATDHPTDFLSLETARDNFPAQGLYERMGWVRDEVYYVYTYKPNKA